MSVTHLIGVMKLLIFELNDSVTSLVDRLLYRYAAVVFLKSLGIMLNEGMFVFSTLSYNLVKLSMVAGFVVAFAKFIRMGVLVNTLS